jgi:hypothetical protein
MATWILTIAHFLSMRNFGLKSGGTIVVPMYTWRGEEVELVRPGRDGSRTFSKKIDDPFLLWECRDIDSSNYACPYPTNTNNSQKWGCCTISQSRSGDTFLRPLLSFHTFMWFCCFFIFLTLWAFSMKLFTILKRWGYCTPQARNWGFANHPGNYTYAFLVFCLVLLFVFHSLAIPV